MVTFRKLLDPIAAESFRPFRIKMANGQAFDIRHPESIYVGKTRARLHDEATEKWHDVSLMLMETIEPMDVAATV